MMAFPLAPVAYAEGKPGNVLIFNGSRTRPGNGSKDPSGPNSFIGCAGRGQRDPGQRAGESVGNPADIDRRPVARQCGSGYSTWPCRQGNHGAWGTGPRFPGRRDGGVAAAGTGYRPGVYSAGLSTHPR